MSSFITSPFSTLATVLSSGISAIIESYSTSSASPIDCVKDTFPVVFHIQLMFSYNLSTPFYATANQSTIIGSLLKLPSPVGTRDLLSLSVFIRKRLWSLKLRIASTIL